MTDFLDFINSAEPNTLTQVPGVTHSISEKLVAARPFDSEEECLKVKGMTKSLLAKLQLFAEAQANESENRAMIPVEGEALASIKKSQPANEDSGEETSFWSRMGKALISFLKALVRLIVLLAFFLAIGAAFYYGLPYIQRTFIAPLDKNTTEIRNLKQEIASLQSQLDEMNTRVGAVEISVESHTASLEKLEAMQAALEGELQANNGEALLALKHEVMMTRALDMLARARLYLAQSNFGLAREDVESARNLLATLQVDTDDEALSEVLSRLDLALGNLPAFPVIASADLEIAWQLLMADSQLNTPTPFVEPPPTVTPTAFPTPFIDTTATP
jgi:hypothetical protein